MKVLIDECRPAGLKEDLAALGHECQTVRRAGFGSKKNGELLALAERHGMSFSRATRTLITAEHDRAQCFHLDPLCEIESHEGFGAAATRLR